MSYMLACPGCDTPFEVSDDMSGQIVQCQCGASLEIPIFEAENEAEKPEQTTPALSLNNESSGVTLEKQDAAKPSLNLDNPDTLPPTLKQQALMSGADGEAPSQLRLKRDTPTLDTKPVNPNADSDVKCPHCNEGVAEGSVICVSCGYNMKTGKELTTQITQAKYTKNGSSGPGISDSVQKSVQTAVNLTVKLVVILLIGGVCYGLYWGYGKYKEKSGAGAMESESFKAYKKFATHLNNREYVDAIPMTKGLAESQVKMIEKRYEMLPGLMPGVVKSSYKVESENLYPSGDKVDYVIRQTQVIDPNPLVPSLASRKSIPHHHEVTLEKDEDEWKVTSFTDQIVKKGSPPIKKVSSKPSVPTPDVPEKKVIKPEARAPIKDPPSPDPENIKLTIKSDGVLGCTMEQARAKFGTPAHEKQIKLFEMTKDYKGLEEFKKKINKPTKEGFITRVFSVPSKGMVTLYYHKGVSIAARYTFPTKTLKTDYFTINAMTSGEYKQKVVSLRKFHAQGEKWGRFSPTQRKAFLKSSKLLAFINYERPKKIIFVVDNLYRTKQKLYLLEASNRKMIFFCLPEFMRIIK